MAVNVDQAPRAHEPQKTKRQQLCRIRQAGAVRRHASLANGTIFWTRIASTHRRGPLNSSNDSLDSHVDRLSGKRRPVVRLVVAATTLGCLLLLAFATWFVWSSRHTQIRQTEVATSNVARMVGVQVETAMKATTMALANVV